jgi:hypothetical protein
VRNRHDCDDVQWTHRERTKRDVAFPGRTVWRWLAGESVHRARRVPRGMDGIMVWTMKPCLPDPAAAQRARRAVE